MSVVIEHRLRSDGLALAPTLATADVSLEVEGILAFEPTHPQLFAWVEGDLAGFEGALAEDPTVTEPTTLSDHGDRRLYRVRTTDAVETVLYPLWVEAGGEGLSARFEDGWWHSRLRFPSRAAAAAYRDSLAAAGVTFHLEGIYADDSDGPGACLTSEQRETLRLAYRRGYFSVPREVTTAELANELGVSAQAVSERLRRGYARLVETYVEVDA